MANDTIEKMRALCSMKDTLLEVTRRDRDRALRVIARRDEEIAQLQARVTELEQKWWAELDEDNEWVAEQLAKLDEAREYELRARIEAARQAMDEDIPF